MLKRLVAVGLLGWLLGTALPARAEVAQIEIQTREPYEVGRAFGTVGPYERLAGRVKFEVNRRHPANHNVVDLGRAPLNARKRVEFSADLEILMPRDLARSNGTALYDVNNRGGKTAEGMFNGGADGFLMRQGYILVRSGWIAELLPDPNKLRLEVPVALEDGRPVRGMVMAEMVTDTPANRLSIAQWAGHGSFPPTPKGRREGRLSHRVREADPRIEIPRSQWRLEQRDIEVGGRKSLLPLVELSLDGGFQPGHIYELLYEAEGSLIQGLGFTGIRDLISFLKYERSPRNPLWLATGELAVKRAIGFGVSQSGRALRHFLYDGFNADEQYRRVFDGVFPHVAGGGMGSFNHRFASPTRHSGQHDSHLYPVDVPPFTYYGILSSARDEKVVPKIFHTQTSAEYWHRSGSLVHTSQDGFSDQKPPSEVRIYAIGGAQHGAGSGIAGPKGNGQLPGNPTDYRPLLRGLLTALNAWVKDDTQPPPSRYPRISDGTLVRWDELRSGWQRIRGVDYPDVIQNAEELYYGPNYGRLTRLPPDRYGKYGVRVPAYGPDNNELGMLMLPSVAAPIATYTGWNLRDPKIGAEQELLSLAGGYIPFARTEAERRRAGDPRLSLEERYGSYEKYRAQFQAAAEALVRERYVLEEDLPRLLSLAERFKEAFAGP